jgi:hypothetical protein
LEKLLRVLFAERLPGGCYLLGCLLFTGFFFFHLGSLGLGLLWVHICLLLFFLFFFLLPSFFQGVFPSSVSLLM